jgi:hypothetical protein
VQGHRRTIGSSEVFVQSDPERKAEDKVVRLVVMLWLPEGVELRADMMDTDNAIRLVKVVAVPLRCWLVGDVVCWTYSLSYAVIGLIVVCSFECSVSRRVKVRGIFKPS